MTGAYSEDQTEAYIQLIEAFTGQKLETPPSEEQMEAMHTALRRSGWTQLLIPPKDATTAVAEAWASIDGRLEAFWRCRDDQQAEDTEGRYWGYMSDAESLIKRTLRRGFELVPVAES